MTSLREAAASDVDDLVALEQVAFGRSAWSPALVRAELEADGSTRTAVVAVTAGRLVGYAVLRYAGSTGDVVRVAVLPVARRRGVGRALTEELLRRARLLGCDEVLLEVAADNLAARTLYEDVEFAEIARRPHYYADGSDALVLRRDLRAETPPTPPRGQKVPSSRGVSGGNCRLDGVHGASTAADDTSRDGWLPS